MRERTSYPAGVPCWVDSTQTDPRKAAEFYARLFGWQCEDVMPPEAPGHYFVATLRGARVAAISSGSDGAPATWNTYISVNSVDESASKVTAHGGAVITAPFDVFDAGRMAVCADPDGALFSLWQPGRHIGAQLVNEPSTWNWSNLITRDPAGARAFYRAVFGWEVASVDFGVGESWMWRRPGYADFLEQLDPGLKQRHREAGAPEGFTDAIGWLQPITDSTPPRWDVTFSVDDTDAIVDRARTLGASVITPPFDVPYSRMAVLRDPQGATFTVSRFTPPD